MQINKERPPNRQLQYFDTNIKHTFQAKYSFDDKCKDQFVEFTESKRKNAKKHKGWILAVEFSGEVDNPLITYTIQGAEDIGKGACEIFEGILEEDIIGTTEIE